MNIILYKPKNKEKAKILSAKVAEIYGVTAQNIIEKLNCSKEQKLKLLDEIQSYKEKTL